MDRTQRIAGEMRRALSDIIQNELKDPRIPLVTSITNIKLAKDLKYAKIYISVFAGDEEKKAAIKALKGSSGFIRRALGQKMIIRSLPELTFVLDESLEYGSYMNRKIDELNNKQ
ncbi:MAG: 30S ribosome-binding factor RbfA [Clostridia bacterium]|nr:30S ribosome-binding factor RbfA [Clostridia bacterium]